MLYIMQHGPLDIEVFDRIVVPKKQPHKVGLGF